MLVTLLTLPLAPVRGVTALARVLLQQAERELYDPASVRRQLDELEDAAANGQISEAELADAQERLIERLVS